MSTTRTSTLCCAGRRPAWYRMSNKYSPGKHELRNAELRKQHRFKPKQLETFVAEAALNGKLLLNLPSGPLTEVPCQFLVTGPPADGDQRKVTWLARERHQRAVGAGS